MEKLIDFRTRLIESHMDRWLFEQTIEVASETEGSNWGSRQILRLVQDDPPQ